MKDFAKTHSRKRRLFTQRQIYVRTRENVKCITLSRPTQMVLCAIISTFLLWIAFITLQFIFSDTLHRHADNKFKQKEAEYQREINELKSAYDRLDQQLSLTHDWFDETVSRLERKHNTINDLVKRQSIVSDTIRDMRTSFAATARRYSRHKKTNRFIGYKNTGLIAQLQSRPRHKPTSLPLTINQLKPLNTQQSDNKATHNTIHMLANNIGQRLTAIENQQQIILETVEKTIDTKIIQSENILKRIIIADYDMLAVHNDTQQKSAGGPYIPFKSKSNASPFQQQIYRISTGLEKLSKLNQSITHLPLAVPLHHYHITSHFGLRIDPFEKKPALHSGIDLGTAAGTPIYTTLSGIVTKAGRKGNYGMLVEINHGNGFKTRYGHLEKIHVKIGQKVSFQHHIGDAGSTGRSTGVHLHYEIWHNGKPHDPFSFLKAGKQIFNLANVLTGRQY